GLTVGSSPPPARSTPWASSRASAIRTRRRSRRTTPARSCCSSHATRSARPPATVCRWRASRRSNRRWPTWPGWSGFPRNSSTDLERWLRSMTVEHVRTHAELGRDYERRWWTLGVLCLSLVMIVVANASLNVALPTLVRDLRASSSALQWIVDAYSLVFAGLLLTAGALGDRYGRRLALNGGLVIFGLASGLAAFAGSSTQLIAARAVMGIGAALVMPATLSVLAHVFPPGERQRAIAIWAGFAGVGAGLGGVTSGWLLQHFWWGSIFLTNVGVVAVALVAGALHIPPSGAEHD